MTDGAIRQSKVADQLPRQTGSFKIECPDCGRTVSAKVSKKEYSPALGFYRRFSTATCRKCGTSYSGIIR